MATRKIPNSMLSLSQLKAEYEKEKPNATNQEIAIYAISKSANYKSKGYAEIMKELESFEKNTNL